MTLEEYKETYFRRWQKRLNTQCWFIFGATFLLIFLATLLAYFTKQLDSVNFFRHLLFQGNNSINNSNCGHDSNYGCNKQKDHAMAKRNPACYFRAVLDSCSYLIFQRALFGCSDSSCIHNACGVPYHRQETFKRSFHRIIYNIRSWLPCLCIPFPRTYFIL